MEAVRPKPKGKSKKKSSSKHKEKKKTKSTTEVKDATIKVEGATPLTDQDDKEEVPVALDIVEKDSPSDSSRTPASKCDDVVTSGGAQSQNEIATEVVQKSETTETIREDSDGEEVKSKPLPIITEAPKQTPIVLPLTTSEPEEIVNDKSTAVDEDDIFVEANEVLSETQLSKERTSGAIDASHEPTQQQGSSENVNDVMGATPLSGDVIATTKSAVVRQDEIAAPIVREQEPVQANVLPTVTLESENHSIELEVESHDQHVTQHETIQTTQMDEEVEASAPALIDLSEEVRVVQVTFTSEVEEEHSIHYPQLDSYLQEEEVMEELVPFTEEDLSLLYPNPQLDTQPLFVDNFIKHSNQERHELYELLLTYLKAKQMLTNTQKQLESLQNRHNTHEQLVWDVETRNISSVGKCGDGSKVTHSHSHKFAVFKPQPAAEVSTALKNIRQLLQEELCMHAYSSQLARVHVENYLFQLMHAFPEMMGMAENAPVTGWVPDCPPGCLDEHTSRLRDSVSVLFMFLRKPVVDKEFSEDCRKWLDILLADLLRVASLVDHQFIFNHLLRCPPGVSKWGTQYLQLLSPLKTKPLLQEQYQNNAPLLDGFSTAGYSQYWGVGLGLHGDWGGPLLDHFVTMLATLLLPIKERESFLSLLNIPVQNEQPPFSRAISQPWIFVEDMEDEETPDDHMLLKESDFISFFDQFPFTDLFQYILQISPGVEYSVEHTASHQVLRLIAFCTCLIRLLGAAFSTLKMARYKEFIKQVGRTIRQTVQYVADHWMSYKAHRLQHGDHMAALPVERFSNGEPRYSLNRLQLEFDQFVLRATQWILTAHRLGAWQFLADMPYGSVSLKTMWMIFWNIYCKPSSGEIDEFTSSQTGSDGSDRNTQSDLENRVRSPTTMEGIQEAMKNGSFKDHFVDRLMKTYTSEAVFLLTTLVNIARARPADSAEERDLINTIVLEIFECTEVIEYARDTYSRTGCNLLDTIAIVHPFCISTLLGRVNHVVQVVGENCILLFKQLSLHLWVPESHDIQLVFDWLIDYPLNSNENLLARVILGGLNWGTKSEDGSCELVLPWSLHCAVALKLVEAHSKHLPSQPGGRNFTPPVSGIGKYLDSKFGTNSDQQAYVTWAWDVVLMLKLHPSQVLSQSMQTLNPIHQGRSDGAFRQEEGETRPRSHSAQRVALSSQQPSWIQLSPHSDELILPDLTGSSERELADLRDSVKYEGLLAYYVALCITSIGTDTDHFMANGLSMLTRLLDQGYYLPTLRVLANVTPRFFKHRKMLIEDSSFIHIVVAICNADLSNASLRERWTFTSPTPLVTRKMAALIQTQIQSACGPGGVGGEAVLRFWLEILLSCPLWYRENSVLHLLDTLCMASFSEPSWQKIIEETLLETYRLLDPVQPRKGLLSSVYSSVASIVVNTGSTPSLFNFIPAEECPWLAYHALCAEQKYENEEEGIWRTLLIQLRNNSKASVDSALKKAFTELKMPGVFPSTHLCIYRWAEFSTVLEHTHPLCPLIWQKFFVLYLQRPVLDNSMPERESQGIRFFASSRSLSLRRQLKTSLSNTCKQLQASLAALDRSDDDKRSFLSRCLKLYQTLRLWLEEPKLHSSSLYIPGLPQQYDAQRLEATMKPTAKPWMEFVPIWEVKGQLNSLIEEWVHVASYQKTLPSKAFPPESSPDTAVTRIQKRLNKRQSPVLPPKFHYCAPPFILLSPDVLLSRESLLAVVHSDFEYLNSQAMSFCTKANALPMLDDQFMSGLPKLYTNEPRQFHVRVPCHSRFNSSHQCKLPATIVFRFNEMTTNPRWEQQLKVNRSEYNEMVTGLRAPVSQDLCQIVMRIEHSVAELSRQASQSTDTIPNIPLQCGIALFYQILQFITPETRQYPPTCQFLTSCLQILGQEFVQRDPMQTTNILNALISQRGNSELLAPLFKPNLCPEQFLHMYSSVAEMAVKEGPSIAFSVLTKFNVVSWLQSYDPNMGERAQLLDFIAQGLALGGSIPNSEAEAMVEVYRHHFVQLLEHKFPEQYYDALQLVINGTDNANIAVSIWKDLSSLLGSPDHPEECKLGLQPILESLNVLSTHYYELRSTSGQSVYSLVNKEYVPVVSQFMNSLCVAMVRKWMEAISMGTAKPEEAISNCWKTLLDAFTPWIIALHNPEGSENKVLPPCSEGELDLMNPVVKEFVDCVSLAHTTITDPGGHTSFMSLLFQYYCSSLANSDSQHYILNAYHTHFQQLPWRSFIPSLATLDSMMKLKVQDHHPPSCFVFLGKVFPLFDWNTIVTAYCDISEHGDSTAPVKFHIVFLQLLVMLAADREVMERDDTGIPEVIAEAQKFKWEYIDAKTFQDVLNWQKTNYDCTTILHTGSCLSLSLRLLKAAAGFQTTFHPKDRHYNETWEKRLSYIQGMVELIGSASHMRETHTLSYSDPVTSLFQTAVDVCVNEPTEVGSANMISLLREMLNLLNISSSTGNMSSNITDIMVTILEELPDVHLITLPLITASCQTIVSHKHMTLVIEHSIEAHFKAITKPDSNTIILPPDPAHGYGWKYITGALKLPQELVTEMCKACFEECAGLVLYAMLMQELPQCMSIEQEYRIGVKVVQWCMQMKPKQSQESKMFLLWEKALGLLMRQVRYSGKFSDLIPHFTTMANSMARFGEDKATEGILGAIGLGKKSCYSHQFRLVSRAMAAFIYCQIPVNTSHTSQLRLIPNAPGHVKDITRNSQGSVITGQAITATKQGDQMCTSLESLMTNKHYSHVKDQVTYAVAFVNNPSYCIMNCNELLVNLCTSLYPSYRYLDLLRVLQL